MERYLNLPVRVSIATLRGGYDAAMATPWQCKSKAEPRVTLS